MVVSTPMPSTLSLSRFTASISVPLVETSLPFSKSVISTELPKNVAAATGEHRHAAAKLNTATNFVELIAALPRNLGGESLTTRDCGLHAGGPKRDQSSLAGDTNRPMFRKSLKSRSAKSIPAAADDRRWIRSPHSG